MMFVGDSLNRGQFVSLVCLLQSVIPEGEKSMETNGSFNIFRAKVSIFLDTQILTISILFSI